MPALAGRETNEGRGAAEAADRRPKGLKAVRHIHVARTTTHAKLMPALAGRETNEGRGAAEAADRRPKGLKARSTKNFWYPFIIIRFIMFWLWCFSCNRS